MWWQVARTPSSGGVGAALRTCGGWQLGVVRVWVFEWPWA